MALDTTIHLAGIITLVGAILYAMADVLLLAHHIGPLQDIPATAVDFGTSEKWRRRANMLACMSKMPWKRLVWGGLQGVLVTPLVMSGAWVLYQALKPAGPWLSVPVALLWLGAYPIGAFIHGSFIYLGGSVQAWNLAEGKCKAQLEDTVARMLRVLLTAYVVFFAIAIATSMWYALAVLQGTTALPRWMALINPALLSLAYIILARKVVPFRVVKYVEGAGFNIVFFLFFALLLIFVW
ncbi:MAG: DUF6796 family protein [Chloroflexota bacterium]